MKGKVLSKVLAVTLAFVMVFTGVGIGQWGLEDASAATSGVVTVDFSAVVGTEDTKLDPNDTGYYFAYMPKTINVSAGLAYQYGLGDKPTTQPTVLDAVVAAHADKYGEAFTKDAAQKYLNAGLGDREGKAAAFGVSNKFFGHVINGLYSDDYASEAILLDGDRVELFTYESNWQLGADYYTTFGTRSITAQDKATLTLKGGCYNTLFSDLMLSNLPEKNVGYIDENGVIQLCSMTDENAILNFTKEECKSLVDTGVITLVAYDATGNDKYFPSAATITFVEELSEQNRLDNIADSLTWMKIAGRNTQNSKVTENLVLMGTLGGVNIAWSSSDENVVTTDGTVKRPAAADGDKKVTLTATLSKGEEAGQVILTKNFNIIVKAEDMTEYSGLKTAIDKTAAYIANNQDNSSKVTLDWWVTVAMSQYELLEPSSQSKISDGNKQKLVDKFIEEILTANLGSGNGNTEATSANKIANAINSLSSMGFAAEKILTLNKTEINAFTILEKIDANKAKEGWYCTIAPYVLAAFKQRDGISISSVENEHIDYLLTQLPCNYTDSDAMMVQGLVPYYDKKETVREKVDNWISSMSAEFQSSGTFGNTGSDAMVIIALCQLGINPDTDNRFIKDGKSLLDDLLSYYGSDDNPFGAAYYQKQGLLAALSAYQVAYTGKAYNPYDFSKISTKQPIATSDGQVKPPQQPTEGDEITVNFSIKGDDGYWLSGKKVTVKEGSTVYHAFVEALKTGFTYEGASTGYVSSITNTTTGKTLAHFDKGPNSGWLYKVNSVLPDVGLTSYTIKDGDNILWYYTDDWTKDPDASKYPGAPTDQSSVTTSGTSGSATTTTPTQVTVSGDTAKATIKTENATEAIKQAKEKKSAEIVIEVANADIKTAEKVQVEIPTATAKEILNATTADLTVKTPIATVTLPRDALKEAVAEAKGTTITVEVAAVSKPTDIQKKAAGTNGQVISVTIKSGSTVISTFGGKSLKIKAEVPTKLKGKKIAAIHIAADGTIEQLTGKLIKEGTKEFYEFMTTHLSTFALVDADELGLEVNDEEANIEKVKKLVSDMSLKASSSKTSKKNIKVTLTVDKDTAAAIKEIEDMGYTVKYKYYRSTRKASKYQAKITKTTKSFTNTSGKKGTKYYYKARVQVYDKDGKLVTQTALKQCRYAARTWTK